MERVGGVIRVIILGCFLVVGTVRSNPRKWVWSAAHLSKWGLWDMRGREQFGMK